MLWLRVFLSVIRIEWPLTVDTCKNILSFRRKSRCRQL